MVINLSSVFDFILDGELIAYAEGRKLGFADLQKRLGRKTAAADFFINDEGHDISVLSHCDLFAVFRGVEMCQR